jgi:MFS family permease
MDATLTVMRAYRWEIGLALLALCVHFACFFVVIHANNGNVVDTVRADDGYFELAQNILVGNGFSWSPAAPYAPNPLRTPGYVYALAGLIGMAGIAGATLIQLIAASAIPIFGMYVARHITASSKIGYLAGVVLSLDPTLALLSFQFYTETLFLILFLAWLLFTLRYLERHDWTVLAASAVLLGGAILVKTSAQYIPLLFLPFIVWHFGKKEWRRGIAHASLYLLIIGAILAPWVVRNIHTFGVPGLSAQTPFVLYTNLAPAVRSVARGNDFLYERQTFMTPAEYHGDVITLANGDIYTARALHVVRVHPLATFFVAGKSLFTFFTNDGFYTLIARSGRAPLDFLPLLFAARLVWIAITITALIGAGIFLLTKRSPCTLLIILLVAYFALTSTIAAFGTNPRYRLPVDPIIIALAAVGGTYFLERIRHFQYVR